MAGGNSRFTADLEAKQSSASLAEFAKVLAALDKIETKAKETQKAARSAREERFPGRRSRPNLSQRFSGRGAGGAGSVLTGEGLVAGPFKFADTGFQIEGGTIISKVGGPLLLAAAGGRVSAGLLSGIVSVRDQIREGTDPLEALMAETGKKSIDIARTLLGTFGLEKAGISLAALFTGETQEKTQQDFNQAVNKIKLLFNPAQAAREEVLRAKQAKELADKVTDAAGDATNQFIASWGLPLSATSNLAADVDRIKNVKRLAIERQEKQLLDEAALKGSDGSGD